jgi:hypothetical protein
VVFVRGKRQGSRTYYYFAENRRDGKKVRQKVIKYLGTERPTREQVEKYGGKYESSIIHQSQHR